MIGSNESETFTIGEVLSVDPEAPPVGVGYVAAVDRDGRTLTVSNDLDERLERIAALPNPWLEKVNREWGTAYSRLVEKAWQEHLDSVSIVPHETEDLLFAHMVYVCAVLSGVQPHVDDCWPSGRSGCDRERTTRSLSVGML